MKSDFKFLDVNFSSFVETSFKHYYNDPVRARECFHLAAVSTLISAHEWVDVKNTLNRGVVIADGAPIRFFARLQKSDFGGIRGADLVRLVIRIDSDRRHFFIGSNFGMLQNLRKTIQELNSDFKFAGSFAPPLINMNFDPIEWLSQLNLTDVDVLWIGLGSPKQDLLASKLYNYLKIDTFAVGAALEFISGDAEECPKLLQNSGLEWLFRLYSEPGRLWKRYLVGNLKFMRIIFLQFIKGIKS